MQFLIAVAVHILKWILEKTGLALYRYVNQKIQEYEQERINKENLKRHKEAIEKAKKEAATDQEKKERLKTGRDLINGKQ